MDFWDIQEDYSIHTTIGYGSKYDEEKVELDICCDCMDELIDKCVISPLTSRRPEYSITHKPVQECDQECGFLE